MVLVCSSMKLIILFVVSFTLLWQKTYYKQLSTQKIIYESHRSNLCQSKDCDSCTSGTGGQIIALPE
jgi:hypothetical protein